MRMKCIWTVGFLGLSALGCGGPPRVVAALPPGVDPATQARTAEGDEAEAIGEFNPKPPIRTAARPKEPDSPPPIGQVEFKTTPTGLKYQVLKGGAGAVARKGQKVTVHYTGWLAKGGKFDSSRDRGEPFEFNLGEGDVIQGWDEGVEGMKVGGVRRLTIPPGLAYREEGRPPKIPPNSTLVFDIELLGVE